MLRIFVVQPLDLLTMIGALRVAVETGSSDGDLVEVKGAIIAGDRVTVRGAERLETGQKVRPVASL